MLDLVSGFWQVPMYPDSIEKMAFMSHAGSYEFLVMLFGLKNTPATFQQLMADVLAGLSQEVCMDYILMTSSLWRDQSKDHLKNLELLLQCLQKAGLKLKPPKCDLFKTQVRYLGFITSATGASTHSRA